MPVTCAHYYIYLRAVPQTAAQMEHKPRVSNMRSNNEHVNEETLERHVLGTLPGGDVAVLEQHLLTCEKCRNRLAATRTYVEAMQTAGRQVRKAQKQADKPVRRPSRRGPR